MQSSMNQYQHNSLPRLEDKLTNLLRPVRPNADFLRSLKTKLTNTPTILLETSKKKINLLLVGAGLFAGALTLWILGRIKKGKS